MKRVVHDPDHPAYSDDAEGETVMKIPVWFDTNGDVFCQDCAHDAAAGGARLRMTYISPRSSVMCDGCLQRITDQLMR